MHRAELGAEAEADWCSSEEEGGHGCGSASTDDDTERVGGRCVVLSLALVQRLFPSLLVPSVRHRTCSWATLEGVVDPESTTDNQFVAAAAEQKSDQTDLSPSPSLYFPASSYGRPTANRATVQQRSSFFPSQNQEQDTVPPRYDD